VLLSTQSWVRLLRFEFFKELHQPINQSASASDDMESALMLMLFQDLVQSTFQFSHTAPPQLGLNFIRDRKSPQSKLLRLLLKISNFLPQKGNWKF
jgi:hypothetical protein